MEPETSQPFLSIIIPVYNQNPEFLERALKSATSQKEASRYEVIVVDDGSTQTAKTAELCLKYSTRFLPLEHQGLSGARDSGILAANGTYISFLDSDDYLSDQFANFVQQACIAQKFEVVFFGNSSGDLPRYVFQKEQALVLNSKPAIQRFFNRLDHLNPGVEIRSSWAKAFRKDFLIQNNLLYPKDLECQGEDHIMMLYLSQKASSLAAYSGYQLYHYELSPLSVSSAFNPKNLERFLALIKAWQDFFKAYPPAAQKRQEYDYTVSCEYLEQLLKLVYCNAKNPAPKTERYAAAKRDLFKAKDFAEAIHETRYSSCPTRLKKINLWCLKHHFYKIVFNHYESKR